MRISTIRIATLFYSISLLFPLISLQAQATIPFTNVNVQAGISFTHADGIPSDGIMDFGTGAVWLDFDRDNDLDLFLTNRGGADVFYENMGNGTFTDVSAAVRLNVIADAGGASAADFNNDGWLDLYVTRADSSDALFKNVGGLYFEDVTRSAGLDTTEFYRGTSASWGDYDNDGYLDLYVANHVRLGYGGLLLHLSVQNDLLYHNNGDGTFTDVSSLLGTYGTGAGFIGGWTDFDNDGDVDIFLVNDCTVGSIGVTTVPTKLLRNDGGASPTTWTFTDVSVATGADDCRNGMGLAVGDYNRDGWLDYYYSNIGPAILLENNSGTFVDKTTASQTGWQFPGIYTWGASFFDYDLDGWLDLYVAAGALGLPPFSQQDYLYHHNGASLTFTDVATASGVADGRMSRTGSTADYDGDGDLDLFVVSFNDSCTLYRNDLNNGKHHLIVDLVGTTSNRDGIGSRLKATTPDGVSQYFETRSGSNLGGGDDLSAHFGLDTNTVITELEIKWPSGTVQRLFNIAADQRLQVTEVIPILPITLASFELSVEGCEVAIDWTTSSEQNSDYFVVERSMDGSAFESVGKVLGAGESEQLRAYSLADREPFSGTSYYRLKQVGISGDIQYSRLEVLQNPCAAAPSFSLYPNPNQGNVSLAFEAMTSSSVAIHFLDLAGKKVSTPQSYALETGKHRLTLSHGLSEGLYFCVMSVNDQVIVKKMVVRK